MIFIFFIIYPINPDILAYPYTAVLNRFSGNPHHTYGNISFNTIFYDHRDASFVNIHPHPDKGHGKKIFGLNVKRVSWF